MPSLPSRPPQSQPLARAIDLYGWTFLGLVAVFSLVNVEGGLARWGYLQPFTVIVPVFVTAGVVLMVLRWREDSASPATRGGSGSDSPDRTPTRTHPGERPRQRWAEQRDFWFGSRCLGRIPMVAWSALLSGIALFLLAGLSLLRGPRVVWAGRRQTEYVVPTWLVMAPVVNGLLALLAGFLVMAVTPRAARGRLLWRLSAVMVPLSLLGWLRVSITQGEPSVRLWTQLGNAAVYPVVLVLCLSIALAAVLAGYRPRVSQVLVVSHLVLLLLTGSRGGIVALAAFIVLLVVRLGRRHTGAGQRLRSLPIWVYLVGGAAVVGATLVSPVLGRLDQKSGRLSTWENAISALDRDWSEWAIGLGSGTMWPWYAWESGWQGIPWGKVTSPHGLILYHAHSLYVTVLVELGIIGVLVLAAVVWPLAARWFRGGSTPSVVLICGVCACLVAFAFDTYVFKNFSVSMLWWAAAFGALLSGAGTPIATTATVADPSLRADVTQ